ncbi:MAG: hypothetical protein ACI9DH_001494 [Halioglobus sp.]|jgi:hypothetical protein
MSQKYNTVETVLLATASFAFILIIAALASSLLGA